jgi:hypothetical protein
MKTPNTTRGLAILAGGLAFVGSANAVDLIVNGSFEDVTPPQADITPNGWVGVCRGYNYSAAYFTGPPIPAAENPGNIYTWRHRGNAGDEAFATPLTQTVNLLGGATAADIDAGRGQYTFSAWLASYGQPGSNTDKPYVTLQFFNATSTQVGSTVVFDRVTGAFFTTFADGVTTFDSNVHLHDWAKYLRTSAIPVGARTALVGIQHSPNSPFSGGPDTYTDLVKLDVTVTDTRPSLDSVTPTGSGIAGIAPVKITLQDGSISVVPGSVVLTFDGNPVTPTVAKVGPVTTIDYAPGLLPANSAHTYTLVYTDNGTPALSHTNSFNFTVVNYATLPQTFAYPSGSGSTPGLTYRTVQALGAGLENTLARAYAHLSGTLIDTATGLPYPNSATPGPNPDGSYNVDGPINFDQAGLTAGTIPGDLPFPGLEPGDQDNFSTEALLNLELPAGYYRFGVNSDDGFAFSFGRDPVDVTTPSIVVGSFDGGRAAADTLFDFNVPTAGVYSARLVFEEGTGGASEELFVVNLATGVRTLINDLTVPGSLRSYRTITGQPRRPYLRTINPAAGEVNVPVDTSISARIWDRTTAVVDGSVQMTLNGSAVSPTVSRDGIVTVVNYQPATPLDFRTAYTVQLTFSDGGAPISTSWTFTTRGLEQPPSITGQWDFNSGNLAATIGLPLEFLGGAGGATAAQTQFGTTASFGLPDINGFPAAVVRMPAAVDNTIGLIMRHGAVPNGGPTGTKVNQWTLIMDIFIPVQAGQWFSFVQIDTPANTTDGDLFANFNSSSGTSGGIGISGNYGGLGDKNLTKGSWHRVAFAVDSASVITKYIDGVKFNDQTTWDGLGLNGRHAMLDHALLFADESGDSLLSYVNSIQFRNYKMRDAELEALGGPSAVGIPTVSGQWDFNDLSTFDSPYNATIGTRMTVLPDTEFSTTFASMPIQGQPADVMQYAAAANTEGYIIVPGSPGNGGGEKINQYTLIMDVMFPSSSINAWHALWQTRTNNADDASLFVRPASQGGGIGISSSYHGTIAGDTWYRLAFTFDLTTSTLKKYIDGTLVGQQTLSEGVDGRWSTGPTALLFADNDGDNAPGNVNSIQFHPRVLSDSEIAALGRATAPGIPLSVPPGLIITSITKNGLNFEISWAGGTGPFQVQRRTSLDTGTWIDVGAPTQLRSATLNPIDATGFFRVIGQ